MPTKPLAMRLPPELLVEIDERRGVLSRTQFVVSAIRQSLARHGEMDRMSDALGVALGSDRAGAGAWVEPGDAPPPSRTRRSGPAPAPKPRVPPEQALCDHDGGKAWQRLGYMTRCPLCGARR